MVLHTEYRVDVIDMIMNNRAELSAQGVDVTALLKDDDTIDRMWGSFQKSIEDYDLSVDEAFRSAIKCVLQIETPEVSQTDVKGNEHPSSGKQSKVFVLLSKHDTEEYGCNTNLRFFKSQENARQIMMTIYNKTKDTLNWPEHDDPDKEFYCIITADSISVKDGEDSHEWEIFEGVPEDMEDAVLSKEKAGPTEREFGYLLSAAKEGDYSSEPVIRHHIRSLWTAFCLHNNLNTDTRQYDTKLHQVFQVIKENSMRNERFDFEAFDLFMGEYLN